MTIAVPAGGVTTRSVDMRSRLHRIEARYACTMLLVNTAGALIVFSYLGFILPAPQRFFIDNLIALVGYNVLATVVCGAVSGRTFRPLVRFAQEGRAATD